MKIAQKLTLCLVAVTGALFLAGGAGGGALIFAGAR